MHTVQQWATSGMGKKRKLVVLGNLECQQVGARCGKGFQDEPGFKQRS